MTATETMVYEHKNIRRLINVLKTATKKLENGEKVDPQLFIKSGSFVTSYHEQKHHAKEENIFFVLLKNYGMLSTEQPLKKLIEEHVEARVHTRHIRGFAFDVEQGEDDALEKLIAEAHKYIHLLSHHILHEEEELFPMSDSLISNEDQEVLTKKFDEYDERFPEKPMLEKLDALEKMIL